MGLPSRVGDNRMQDMVEMRLNGSTLFEIAKRFGCTQERIRILMIQAFYRYRLWGRVDHMLGVKVSNVEPKDAFHNEVSNGKPTD